MASTPIRIEALRKRFGDFLALNDVDVTVAEGEFFTLLGSSGCGKTTLLRIVAGFLKQTSGRVLFGDVPIDGIPAHRRNTGMVFQNYAIFPHLSVRDNIAYGLRARRIGRQEIERRVARMLSMTRLDGLAHRKPRELSGGQQQRVVLARAVVIEPNVLLMDEPLSNLDAEMRVHLRNEIRALQRQIGVTTIYVTHDQEEALSLSDRIAVMQHGRIEQTGTPHAIFNEPATRFVAGFIGESNFLPARRVGEADAAGIVSFEVPGGSRLLVPVDRVRRNDGAVSLAFRPHQVRLRVPESEAALIGVVVDAIYTGASVRYTVEIRPGVEVTCLALMVADAQALAIGEKVSLGVPASAITAFPEAQP
jgi:ABC-type Fe3+/spermidine/putrescine transport system ATPase subunit